MSDLGKGDSVRTEGRKALILRGAGPGFLLSGSMKSLIAGSDGKQSQPGLMGAHPGTLLEEGG